MEKKLRLYGTLFLSTFYISAFTFGGGYVILPMMKKKFVDRLHWIDENEMYDLMSIAQSSPGAMAVNVSVLVGYRLSGVAGALIAILGTIIPPLTIITLISIGYEAFRDNRIVALVLRGMRAGVAAIIVDVVITLLINIGEAKKILPYVVAVAAFMATAVFHVNIVAIIAICALIGLADGLVLRGKKDVVK